ncbi:DUF106 domain-containing protein [Candidatus Woesearchaeota archaeon]|nr:DUF106 domain-containing protein [Candidatus Woesearchaeota archaeon]
MSFLDPVFNPIFQPLLRTIGSFWTIFIIAVVYSVYATYVYKYLTNQVRLKEIKDRQKELQKELRAAGKENPEKMMSIHKELMSLNKDYMFQASFKPMVMIATMIPALIIFTWMAGALAYEPIVPDQTYTVLAQFAPGVGGETMLLVANGTQVMGNASVPIVAGEDAGLARWNLKSSQGLHNLTVRVGEQTQSKEILVVSDEHTYAPAVTMFAKSDIKSISIEYAKLQPLGSTFNIFGWYPGWLGIYVILSLILSIGLRKVFNVY